MGAFKIGALWMAGWIGGSSVIGTSSNSYSMGITGVWYVGEIAIGACSSRSSWPSPSSA